jgi:hypothetical protein
VTPEKRWKAAERAVASALGGRRVPITGRARGDVADVACPLFAVEVKSRLELPGWLLTAMAQAKASARGEQVPIVVLHEVGRRHAGDVVLLRLADFAALHGDPTPRAEVSA